MSTSENHVFWFNQAKEEKASLLSRANVPLGPRGRLRMLALGLLLIPAVAAAGFASFVATGDIAANAADPTNVVALQTVFDCTVENGGGTNSSCVASGDASAVSAAFADLDNLSIFRVVTDYRNDEAQNVCAVINASVEANAVYTLSGNSPISAGATENIGVRVTIQPAFAAGDALALDYTIDFDRC